MPVNSFRRSKIVPVYDMGEFNMLLKEAQDKCIIRYGKKENNETLGYRAYVWEDLTKVHLLAKLKSKTKEYVFSLCEGEILEEVSGGQAFAIMSRYARIQRCKSPETKGSAAALLYKNPKFAGKRVKAYEYDINSAFASQLLEPIPDLTTLKSYEKLKEGQIGFYQVMNEESGTVNLEIGFEVGKSYRYVCDLMPSPFTMFVLNWYEKKKEAKSKKARAKAKAILNFAIGNLQNYNPFLRACIIGRSNAYTQSFIDDNTIYANTDSIVSSVPRPDIEALIGENIGERKKEHYGDLFAWQEDAMNYQRNEEIPIYRGIPKKRFERFKERTGRNFDILNDKPPRDKNSFKFDYKTLQIEEIIYEEKVQEKK